MSGILQWKVFGESTGTNFRWNRLIFGYQLTSRQRRKQKWILFFCLRKTLQNLIRIIRVSKKHKNLHHLSLQNLMRNLSPMLCLHCFEFLRCHQISWGFGAFILVVKSLFQFVDIIFEALNSTYYNVVKVSCNRTRLNQSMIFCKINQVFMSEIVNLKSCSSNL